MDTAKQQLLRTLLKQVSRSFYLSLRFLPVEVRDAISLAYLLARTSDTIADTVLVPVEQRLSALQHFALRVADDDKQPLDFGALASHQGDDAERRLLLRVEDALALLATLPEIERDLVRRVLHVIIGGQELDLKRFIHASEGNLVALRTADELDDYTYRVAGCVGEFWTRICFARLEPKPSKSESEMIELGVRYGKGLQLINILRDLPRDLRQGRCYLPAEELERHGLRSADLLDVAHGARARQVCTPWLAAARRYLADGWTYTSSFPRCQARVRICSALPILIGLRTLEVLERVNILDAQATRKIPRAQTRGIILRTVLLHPFGPAWQRLAQTGAGPTTGIR